MPGADTGCERSVRVIDGRYRVVALLACGGSSRVYRAIHETLGRPVALKVLERSLGSAEEQATFARETAAARLLSHRNIVSVHDAGVSAEGEAYLAMDLLEGPDLAAVVRRGPPPAGWAAATVRTTAQAIEAAHTAGVIHRDLKPSNLRFRTAEARPQTVQVLDFGVARIIGGELPPDLTGRVPVHGTPLYMAPEQARRGTADERTDVYALGVVLFELLTGAPPFSGPTGVDVLLRHCTEPVPEERLSGLPAGLVELVLQMLAKDPCLRPASAAEVAARLRPWEERDAIVPELGPAGDGLPPPADTVDVERGEARPRPRWFAAGAVVSAAFALGLAAWLAWPGRAAPGSDMEAGTAHARVTRPNVTPRERPAASSIRPARAERVQGTEDDRVLPKPAAPERALERAERSTPPHPRRELGRAPREPMAHQRRPVAATELPEVDDLKGL